MFQGNGIAARITVCSQLTFFLLVQCPVLKKKVKMGHTKGFKFDMIPILYNSLMFFFKSNDTCWPLIMNL